MKNIEVKILNPEVTHESEKMMVAMARLTQRGHNIQNMHDFEELLNKSYKDSTVKTMCNLPHPTIQKFGVINVAVVGVSRRFLGQITRHQNEVKFMSSSLQYSNYSGKAQFVVPYEYTVADSLIMHHKQGETTDFYTRQYLQKCERDLHEYEKEISIVGHDAASYQLPQGLRGVLLISATPYQLKHMISQRTCNRNTLETQYVMLKIWEELYPLSAMYEDCGPTCMHDDCAGVCFEGKMNCGDFPQYDNPTDFLNDKFKLIRGNL